MNFCIKRELKKEFLKDLKKLGKNILFAIIIFVILGIPLYILFTIIIKFPWVGTMLSGILVLLFLFFVIEALIEWIKDIHYRARSNCERENYYEIK
jgi:hypothetical protein